MTAEVVIYAQKWELRGAAILAYPVADRSTFACQAPACADKPPPAISLIQMVKGDQYASWPYFWHPIIHGIAECQRCGSWHRLYHYPEPRDGSPPKVWPELLEARNEEYGP
jgi:hypothetical protein